MLINTLSKPSVELIADIQILPYAVPNKHTAAVAPLTRKFEIAERISPIIDSLETNLDYYQRSEIKDSIAKALVIGSQSILSNYESFLIAEVRNKGKQLAEEITLQVPNAIYVQMTKPGSNMESKIVSGVIELGNLRPGETLFLYIWTDYKINNLDYSDFLFSHSTGYGNVNLFIPTISWASGLAKLLTDGYFWFLVTIFLLSIMAVIFGFKASNFKALANK